MSRLKLTTFRIGETPRRGQGLRVGVVRRPPRGIARTDWAREGYFDIWLPTVAPSAALLRRFRPKTLGDPAVFRRFAEAYERELERSDARQTVALLAAVAARTPVAVGCYCEDESHCHRLVLKAVMERRVRS